MVNAGIARLSRRPCNQPPTKALLTGMRIAKVMGKALTHLTPFMPPFMSESFPCPLSKGPKVQSLASRYIKRVRKVQITFSPADPIDLSPARILRPQPIGAHPPGDLFRLLPEI